MKTIPLRISIISLLLTSFQLYGQSDTINQTINDLKQGYWIVFGIDRPDKDYPDEGKVEEGKYLDNRKEGMWIKYHQDGITPRLKGSYKNGRPNGPYTKIHTNGEVRESGNYHNKKMTGHFETRNSEGIVTQRKDFNPSGKEEGLVEYFFDDGSPQMILNKKNGVTYGDAITYYPNGDIKKVISYNDNGEVLKKEEKDRVNPPKGEEPVGAGGPKGDRGIIKDGKPFDRDGYNKLYNENDEIWMDGEFKGSKLWNGELFKYDSDGILLKIEIWKEGKYHSDGHL